MNRAYDTLVIGAGQAGLAAGYHLKRAGLRFMLLDAAEEIGAAWKERWDSLRLFTPARYNALPGMAFPGERYSLPTKDEVAGYLKAYAQRFDLPVRLRTPVSGLRAADGRYIVSAGGESFTARSVIVATGANQQPYLPAFAAELGSHIVQLHSSAYRRPTQLPEGSVLVVGAGNSGAQIALELAASGRKVVLSGPDTGSLPRRLLGRDIYDWLWPTIMRPSVDSALGRRLMQGRLFAGDPLVGMSAKSLARPRLERAGKTVGARGGLPLLADGRVLADIAAIVWCTGFRPDFSWIELPVLGLDGYPRHRRGIAQDVRGLAFLGMRYQYRMGSALLGGVGEDAAYVAAEIASFLRPEAKNSVLSTKYLLRT
ncbi:MAG TPA: NAD(P)-binding domain-containing protein [Burkholderiales bacterium]|nr:NAD(P)-binding domain-containing protein [Burkholderiales bacterium]